MRREPNGFGATIRAGVLWAFALFCFVGETFAQSCPTGQVNATYIATFGSFFGISPSAVPADVMGTSTTRPYYNAIDACQSLRQYFLSLSGTPFNAANQRPHCIANGTNSARMCPTADGSGCGTTANINVAAPACRACGEGLTAQGGVCVPDSCGAGTVKHTGTLFQSAMTSTGYCSGGCAVTPSAPVGGVCVSLSSGGQTSCSYSGDSGQSITWTATGSACPDARSSPSSAPVVTTETGETYTLQPNGCGKVNGESYCAGDLPTTTGCVQTAGGQMFCTSTTASPPAPAQPGTNTPPPPSSTLNQVTNTTNNTTINHYNTTVVNNNPPAGTTSGGTTGGTTGDTTGGTTGGSGGGGGGGGSTGGTGGTTGGECGGVGQPLCEGTGGTGGTTSGTTGGECGAAGQPACGVKVDETGTPTELELDTAVGYDHDAAGDALNDTATTSPLDGLGLTDALSSLDLGAGNCTSISPTFTAAGHSYSFTFPGDRGCAMIDTIKAVVGWLIGILTVVYIVRRFASV